MAASCASASAGARVTRGPLFAAAVAVAVYALLVGLTLRTHPAADYAMVGARVHHASPAIVAHAHPGPQHPDGYDGQFAYFIALDPLHAASALDSPAYRYSHIAYPMLARAVALGDPDRIPAALLLVNFAALFVATFALAVLLRRARRSPLLALVFSFYPGVFFVLGRDLNELVAWAFTLAAVALLDWAQPRRVAVATVLFAAAGLGRETALLVPLAFALWHAREHRDEWRRAATLACGSVAPYAAWRAVLLWWLPHGQGGPQVFASYPFAGAIHGFNLPVVAILLPIALILVACAGRWNGSAWTLVLALQLVAFVVMLPAVGISTYTGGYRTEIGVVVGTLLACDRPRRRYAIPAVVVAVAIPALVIVASLSGGRGLRPL